jgi:hypothetical protein
VLSCRVLGHPEGILTVRETDHKPLIRDSVLENMAKETGNFNVCKDKAEGFSEM